MENTKIDWCDSTWNPVTGCLHGCEYCYAKNIAHRFSGGCENRIADQIVVLNEKVYREGEKRAIPYPYGFLPTFHRYRLGDYTKKQGRNVFVCSMADLFGKWVPDDWKIEVLEACKQAPQHNYLFLTKDPIGYSIWPTEKYPDYRMSEAYTDNMWLGITYTGTERLHGHYDEREVGERYSGWTNFWYLWRMSDTILPTKAHKFMSIEPLSCDICEVEDEREGGKLLEHFLLPDIGRSAFEWVIIGAETGRRKGKVIPEREWVEKILRLCRKAEIPVFMKESLREVRGEELVQEYPVPLQNRGRERT